jgi:integrase/recombinase XerD
LAASHDRGLSPAAAFARIAKRRAVCAAARAGIEAPVSPHWLRHAHASHAIDRGATLPEVQSTLGHGNIATTSGYLHARPESSIRECFFDDEEQ